MRVIEISRFGEPEVLVETTRPDPVPGRGEVLVRVLASGVNRPDVMQRKGEYPPPPGASDLPGLEVAGTVAGGDFAELAQAGLKLGGSCSSRPREARWSSSTCGNCCVAGR